MESTQALKLLTALSNGINPITAEAFPAESPHQHPDIVRALFHAVRALEGRTAAGQSADQPANDRASANASADPSRTASRPGKAGKPWSQPEDDELLAAYDAGQTIEALAQTHQRSRLGVEARLARYGRVPMPAGVRSMNGQRRPTNAESDRDAPITMEGAPPYMRDAAHVPPYEVRDAAHVSYTVRSAVRVSSGMHS
ncbi:MAG: hypothetical protein ACKVQU_31015 [Burkholderiales bacterium]